MVGGCGIQGEITMKLVKALSLLVALAGLLLLAAAVAPSASGQARTIRAERHGRDLRILAGRGAEIGVSVRDAEPSEKGSAGVVIDDVRPDSPAEQAGLRKSDVIVEFDGERVRSARQFSRLVEEAAPGRTVKATVLRDGARKDVQITPSDEHDSFVFSTDRLREGLGELERLPERLEPFMFDFHDFPYAFDTSRGRLGVTVHELTPQLAAYFGVKDGVLVAAVTDDSPAAHAGVKAGDVITKVNDAPVRSREDLVRELREVKDDGQVTLGIMRDKKETTVTAKIEPRRRARRGVPA